jgi:TonB family protein
MTSERTLDWLEGITQHLVHSAARHAPEALSARLEEEWLADLAERHGRLSRVRFALGCCWATRVIAYDQGLVAVPAASTAAGHGSLYRQDSPFFSRRTITFLLVACLHAAVLYGLLVGLHSKFVKLIPTQFVIRVVDPPRRELPPTPRPQVSIPKIEVPPPEVMPQIKPDSGEAVTTTPLEPQRTELPPSLPAAVNRVQGGPGPGFPSADDFYPSIAIHMEEKGVATVRACVDGKGRLTAEPTIIQSTGSSRLDEGALKLAKAGSGHYRATTEDGQPVNSCYPFRIRFDLRN